MMNRGAQKGISAGLLAFGLVFYPMARAIAQEGETPEESARRIHALATSDVIYTQEEPKALYYQNQQIIDLLKDIRDILDERLKKE